MPHYTPSPVIRHLFEKGQPMTFGKGSVVLGNDVEPDGLYYIESGFVKIYSISDTGDEYLHIIYGHGEIFPLIWAYLGLEPEDLFCETISDCMLWRISREWFQHYVRLDIDLCYEFSVQLARQFDIYVDRVDNLEYKKASQRIAYRLLFLANRFGIENEPGHITIDVPITHEIFGNSINLTRESVSRRLEIFKEQGILAQEGNHFVILNLRALSAKLSRPANFRNWTLPIGKDS